LTDLSIVIVSFNGRELLQECLSSLFAAKLSLSYEVHVVDNASSDGTPNMVQNEFPQVHLVANADNIGFAGANNQILRDLKARYALLLNPDMVVAQNAIEAMVGFMDTHADIGALGPRLLNPDGSLQYSCRRFPNAVAIFLRGLGLFRMLPKLPMRQRYFMLDWDHRTVAEVDWIMGSCMMLRREALQQVGFLDERFFMYYEDVDLCRRMWKQWKVCYLPEIPMLHHHRQESHRLSSLRVRFIHLQSAWRFFAKHGWCPTRPECLRVRVPSETIQ